MAMAWDELHGATIILVGSGNIKSRLVEAYQRHLVALEPAQLPRELRERFARLLGELTQVTPLRGEDAVTATVRKMSNQEADACALRVAEMLGDLHRWQLSPPRPALEVVPAYPDEAAVSRA